MGLSNLEIQNQITTAFSIWSIKPKDFGVTSRKVNYWKSKGLLPFVLDEKHLVMNIYQGLWFHIIQIGRAWTSAPHISRKRASAHLIMSPRVSPSGL